MDEQKRMLATALRDMVGWSVGMVLDDGGVVVGWRRSEDIAGGWYIDVAERDGNVTAVSPNLYGFQHLPDPDAPANWGVWLAWCDKSLSGVTLRHGMYWSAESECGALTSGEHDLAAEAMLHLWCQDNEGSIADWPPSVTTWREAQQEAGR